MSEDNNIHHLLSPVPSFIIIHTKDESNHIRDGSLRHQRMQLHRCFELDELDPELTYEEAHQIIIENDEIVAYIGKANMHA
jgi:hypothetical protein